MPCDTCNSRLVYYANALICPKCNNMKLVDSLTASILSCKRVHIFRKLWNIELEKIHKDSLMLHVVVHRENLARKFFREYSVIELGRFFSDTLFLKKIQKFGNPEGKIIIDDVKKSEPIIKLFNELSKIETDDSLIKSGYAVMQFKEEFTLDSITDERVLDNFLILQTEEYINLTKSYENYGLFSEKDGQKQIEKHQEEFNEVTKKEIKPKKYTPKEFIEKNYDTISSLYVGLIRNEIYSEVFDLREFVPLLDKPSKIMEFINQYRYDSRGISECPTTQFLIDCKKFFSLPLNKIKKIFLLDDQNKDSFPLFVRIKAEGKDFVIISHTFTIFIYILLYVLIPPGLFKNETSRRGKKFERKVQNKFEKLGYSYLPNYKDKLKNHTLEIDGIATKDKVCYIVECKNPRLPPLVESFEARQIMTTDLKGIIDGMKRTTKNNERIVKKIPSLPEKVEFVKKNLQLIGLQKDIESFQGVVITSDYPMLNSYKKCVFCFVGDITNVF